MLGFGPSASGAVFLQFSRNVFHAVEPADQLLCRTPVATLFSKDDELEDVAVVIHDKTAAPLIGPRELNLLRLDVCDAHLDDGVGRNICGFYVQAEAPAQIGRYTEPVVVAHDLPPQRPGKPVQVLARLLVLIGLGIGGRGEQTGGKAGERDGGRDGVAVDSQVGFGVGKGAIEHDVVGLEELAAHHDLEAQAKDVAAIDGAGVRVVDLEGRDRRAGAVAALLQVGELLCGAGAEPWGRRAAASGEGRGGQGRDGSDVAGR